MSIKERMDCDPAAKAEFQKAMILGMSVNARRKFYLQWLNGQVQLEPGVTQTLLSTIGRDKHDPQAAAELQRDMVAGMTPAKRREFYALSRKGQVVLCPGVETALLAALESDAKAGAK